MKCSNLSKMKSYAIKWTALCTSEIFENRVFQGQLSQSLKINANSKS